MYKSFVLKFVAEPSKLMFASCKGAFFSMGSSITMWIISWMFLGISLSTAAIIAFSFFIAIHAVMIVMTLKDPYFFNAWEAALLCKKTKNLIYTKDNLYGY
jgi:hypothetical protein